MAHHSNSFVWTVIAVKPFSGYYPCCCECLRKLTSGSCHRCHLQYPPDEVTYRYCVGLTVTDLVAWSDVVVFGASLDSVFGVTASGLHRILDNIHPSNERSLSLALKTSLENAFVGRCFGFEFRGLTIPHESSVSLSAVLRQSRLGPSKRSHPSPLVAARIRQLGTSADVTVLSGIRKYLQQLEFPRNESSTQGSSWYSSPQSGLLTSSESDTSSLLYRSVEQDESCCVALRSFEDTVTSSAPTPPSTASAGTPQTGHSNTGTPSPCVHESREESGMPSISGFLNESSFAFLGSWDRHAQQAISPSHSCVRSCGECSEEPLYSDLEANEILHELITDWESTQRQQAHTNPSTEKEFSPSTLSADFLTNFMSSFREDTTTPSPTQLYASKPADIHSADRAGFVETPLFSTQPITPGVNHFTETPELFSRERNVRTPYSLPVVSRLRTLESSSASPELFGSSQPPRHPVLQVVDSFMRVRPSVTPAISRSLSALPRRNIFQDISNTDQLVGVPTGPTQCARQSTDSVATPSQQPLDRTNLFNSPDLFSP